MAAARVPWNALIRTHHITSRKKVAKLRQAAAAYDVFVLLRNGSPPGIMYVEGLPEAVDSWVATVQNLRYKDFHLASRAAAMIRDGGVDASAVTRSGLFETGSVKDFGLQMQQRGIYGWWRKGMGYADQDDRL